MMVKSKLSLQVIDRLQKIGGSTLLGVYACCTDELLLVPPETGYRRLRAMESCLGATSITLIIGGSYVVGSLVAGNATGFVVTSQASEESMRKLAGYGRVAKLPEKINAAGNVILTNDNVALVHPDLSNRSCETISRTLGVTVRRGTIGGLKTVGMAAVATNRGLLVHPRITPSELSLLEDLFNLPVDVGTINFGSPLVGSGVLANSYGYVAGEDTTGPELGRIEEALGFLG